MTFSNFKNDFPEFHQSIHQAALDPYINEECLNQICDIARHFNFAGLCTNLIRLPKARKRLGKSSQTKLIGVISFPFGSTPTILKKEEAEWAISHGAEELDVVPNLFALSQGSVNFFAEEIAELCELDLPIRVILDITKIPKDMLSLAVEASIEAGVYGIQSGNGFGSASSQKDIKELDKLIRGRCAIKAVGGIKHLPHVIELIQAGSNEIGTSYGSQLMQELKETSKK
tara:strand:+ start:252 stop:938 length:687 start_codon:yes stop_codon:yes gene_type:complete